MPKAKSRTVSLFRNGRSQALRIPKEFEFDAEKAVITLNPNDQSLTIAPAKPPTIAEVLDELIALEKIDGPLEPLEIPDFDVPLDDDPLAIDSNESCAS